MTDTLILWTIVLSGSAALAVLGGFIWDLIGPALCDALFPLADQPHDGA